MGGIKTCCYLNIIFLTQLQEKVQYQTSAIITTSESSRLKHKETQTTDRYPELSEPQPAVTRAAYTWVSFLLIISVACWCGNTHCLVLKVWRKVAQKGEELQMRPDNKGVVRVNLQTKSC
ncbi:hypothetical protein ElyMa_003842400 [Elysia marginata]|uniref:Uncharacterized protein n=1 Tax=Elysia marginata TaxID=1093978 RepID=A0AAV4FGV2_9GAST|nr:hypothetical protein ElyMa_003842400 [Elysia marginata]